ncbi:MAG: hypothetical protein PHQ60_14230 [Sideroxydans sp.]|nr:hypothetical protein [Sideroxydans sp.]
MSNRILSSFFIHFARISYWIAMLCTILLMQSVVVSAAQTAKTEAPQLITVDAHAAYDVSGHGDIKQMRGYFQGASWEKPISPETWQRLQPLGLTKIRLINVESRNMVQIDSAKHQVKFDFKSLQPGLQDCKKYHLIPHIIVGQNPQSALLIEKGEKKFGVSDWEIYGQYAYAFLKYVMVEQGIMRADFEVANEPDINGASWLLPNKLPYGDSAMYAAYLHLYQVWSGAADRLSREHPELSLRIGGPDSGPYTFAGGSFNWYGQFAKDVVKQKLRLDFCSFHFYGNESALAGLPAFGPYPSFAGQIEYIRNSLNNEGLNGVPIYITEWGPSNVVNEALKGVINGNHIGAAWTARFLIDMVDAKVDDGMALILRDHTSTPTSTTNNWSWPGFLLSDNVTTKAFYDVALMFMMLPEQRVKASAVGSLGVLAGASNRKVGVLVFNQNWDFLTSRERAKTERINLQIVGLPFATAKVKVTRYLVDETHGNAYSNFKRGLPMDQKKLGLHQLKDSIVPINNGAVNLTDIDLEPSSVSLWKLVPMR